MEKNISKYIFIIFLLVISLSEENINKAMDLYMKGELSLLTDDINSAEKYFYEALSYSPNDPGILLSLLEIQIKNKNFIGIEKVLDKYLKIEQLNIHYSLEIVDLYKVLNNENIFNVFDSLIENNPENIELKYAKAEILILNEHWEELLFLYSDIYIIEQKDEILDTLLNMGLMIEEPIILYNALKHIWNNDKYNIEILELLIQLSYLSDENKQTKEYLDELIKYDPSNNFAIMMLAEISILDQNFLKAIELLNKIKINKDTPFEFYKMLLIAYSNIEDYDNEIAVSIKLIENFPFEAIGYESLAISYLELGKYADAIEVLNKAVEIFPEEYYFYYYLGLCYRDSAKNKEAINYCLKALKINPELKNVMHELAKLYNLESDYDKSDSLFTILLEKNINDAIIFNCR